MIIDVHTHIFPPEVVQARENFFPGEPEFRLLYESPRSKIATAEILLNSMDECGVDCSVTFGFPWRTKALLERHNDYVIQSASKFPTRLIPLACLDLLSEQCIAEAKLLCQKGFRGFGELAIYSDGGNIGLALENFKQIALLCREKRLVLLTHANEPVGHLYPGKAPFGLEFFYSLVKEAPGTPLILAHWGGGMLFFELLKKEAPEVLANVYYDTAASPFVYKEGIYQVAAQIAGAGKILFGSDYPLISPKRYFSEIEQSGLSDSEMKAILGANAARIFGIPK
ncbi:MAG: amidohydrolase family protein [Syntrophobacteraceae bacterium]